MTLLAIDPRKDGTVYILAINEHDELVLYPASGRVFLAFCSLTSLLMPCPHLPAMDIRPAGFAVLGRAGDGLKCLPTLYARATRQDLQLEVVRHRCREHNTGLHAGRQSRPWHPLGRAGIDRGRWCGRPTHDGTLNTAAKLSDLALPSPIVPATQKARNRSHFEG